VIDRNVEEALDRGSMKIKRQYSVDARRDDQIGHEFG
jgi:hypothetical protein